MLKDINAYKVFKIDNERNNLVSREPYLKKSYTRTRKANYNSFLKNKKTAR